MDRLTAPRIIVMRPCTVRASDKTMRLIAIATLVNTLLMDADTCDQLQ